MNQKLIDGARIDLIWERTKLFLDRFTIQTNDFKTFEIYGYIEIKDGELIDHSTNVIHDINQLFGKPKTEYNRHSNQNGTKLSHPYFRWEIDNSKIEEAIDYIEKKPWNKDIKEPLLLIITFGFYFKDPASKLKLPNQQYSSHFSIWFSKTCSVCPDLFLPFEEPNEQFESYMKQIAEFLPFKIEEKQYRIGKANKKGTANQFVKFDGK